MVRGEDIRESRMQFEGGATKIKRRTLNERTGTRTRERGVKDTLLFVSYSSLLDLFVFKGSLQRGLG